MPQPLSFLVKLCMSGTLLAGAAWPQSRAEWIIDTIAGRGVGDGSPAVQAPLARPEGVVVDAAGNLYIADTGNNCIRRVDGSGTITTVAGTGEYGYSGDGGPGGPSAARLSQRCGGGRPPATSTSPIPPTTAFES